MALAVEMHCISIRLIVFPVDQQKGIKRSVYVLVITLFFVCVCDIWLEMQCNAWGHKYPHLDHVNETTNLLPRGPG